MKKISSEDCINEIDKVLPGKKWKRVSKKTVIEREFEVVGQPSVKVLVREDGGKLSVSFGQYGEPLKPEPNAKRLNKDDYYFDPDTEEEFEYLSGEKDGPPHFNIVSKEFWDQYGHLDDGVNQSNVKMPEGFCEAMEGCFEFDGTKEDGIKKLLAAGFTQIPEKSADQKDVIPGILFAVIPMRRDGSDNVMVWFADKDKFLKHHKKEEHDGFVLTCTQRDLLNEAMEKAGFIGGEVEDGADGFSLEYKIEDWPGHPCIISANVVRDTLRKIGFSEDPKYDKWVSQ